MGVLRHPGARPGACRVGVDGVQHAADVGIHARAQPPGAALGGGGPEPQHLDVHQIQDPGDHDRGAGSRLASLLGHQTVADVEPLVAALAQALEGDHIREGGEQPVGRRAVIDKRSRQPSRIGLGHPQHMGPASRKQGDVACAEYVRLSPCHLHADFASFHEMNRAQVVALHPCRRRMRGDFGDVVSGEVNRAQHR